MWQIVDRLARRLGYHTTEDVEAIVALRRDDHGGYVNALADALAALEMNQVGVTALLGVSYGGWGHMVATLRAGKIKRGYAGPATRLVDWLRKIGDEVKQKDGNNGESEKEETEPVGI